MVRPRVVAALAAGGLVAAATIGSSSVVRSQDAPPAAAPSAPFDVVEVLASTEGRPPPVEDDELADVGAGIRWLRSVQQPDGRWTGGVGGRHDVATTSLVLLAFFQHGHTHRVGRFKRTVRNATRWLKSATPPDARGRASGLEVALRTWALADAYAISRDFTLKPYVKRAVAELEGARAFSGWGWRLRDPRPNTLVTGLALLALGAAERGNLAIDAKGRAEARAFLAGVSDETGLAGLRTVGDGVSLAPPGERGAAPGVPLFTAAALLGRLETGEAVGAEIERMVARIEAFGPGPDQVEPLYWLLATRALGRVDGEAWSRWARSVAGVLGALQSPPGGHQPGSWPPVGVLSEIGGRPATTAGAILILGACWDRGR